MELSAAFEERVRQMEDSRNHRPPPRLSRRSPSHLPPLRNPNSPASPAAPPSSRCLVAQAEKEIQAAKSRILASKLAGARRLERRAADLASRAIAARADIDAARLPRLAVTRDLSSVRGEIEEEERREEDWDRFYEAKRKEMEEFQEVSQRFEAETREEVQRLRDLVSQLKSTLQELQSSEMYSNDTEIAAAEARKSDLTDKKAKMDESLASARQFRALLQQQLQKAFQSQVGGQKTAQATI